MGRKLRELGMTHFQELWQEFLAQTVVLGLALGVLSNDRLALGDASIEARLAKATDLGPPAGK